MGSSDSKLKYQKAAYAMHEKHIPPTETEYWNVFFTLPTSVDDLFATLNPDDVRQVRRHHPENLATLIHKAVAHMNEYVALGPQATLRHQDMDNSDDFLQKVLWLNQIPSAQPAAPEEEKKADPALTELAIEALSAEPLSDKLMINLYRLCFLPFFTISRPSVKIADTDDEVPLQCAWAPGTGTPTADKTYTKMDLHRAEILRCMLACCSSPLYRTPQEEAKAENRFLDIAVAKTSFSRVFFHSLLNNALAYDPVGWGIPYNHVLWGDYKEPLAIISLQLLVVLLNHTSGQSDNVYLALLRSLNKADDFKFILKGIEVLLTNRLTAPRTYLPSSAKAVGFVQELLMVFWKLITENRAFVMYAVKFSDINKLVVPVLHFIHEHRKDPAQAGIVHLGTFILLCLSGDRDFSVALNTPYRRLVPIDLPPFDGTNVDFLLLVIHRILTDGQPRLYSLFECLLTVLVNVSPYVKSLSMVTSIKLIKLFEALSAPGFLFKADRNFRYLIFLLESFNNIIQYQSTGNYRLVYAIIQHRERFQALADLQLPASQAADAAALPSATSVAAVPSGSQSELHPWHPTSEWLVNWKAQMPLGTILRMLNALVPQVSALAIGSAEDEGAILAWLQKTTLVGILPVPHPILVRQYQANQVTNMWFTTYMWGVIFLQNKAPPLYAGTTPRLFVLNHIETK